MTSEPAITTSSIWFRYSAKWVLSDVSLNLRKGEVSGLIGANGTGKTTLLKVIARLIVPQRGRVLYGGQDIATINARERARWVGYLPQENELTFAYRVAEVVAAGRAVFSPHPLIESRADYERIQHALSSLGLTHLAETPVDMLSSGERQRVSLARLLAQDPAFMLLDEPTVYLDPGQKSALIKTLRNLADTGYGVVIATHDRDVWNDLDRVFVVTTGQVEEISPQRLQDDDFVGQMFAAATPRAAAGGMTRAF
ncbi:MAG: ABC transporter ATP-binding protein [bacterium JZ-2024 1]